MRQNDTNVKCQIAPKCNDIAVIRKIATASLESHANIRYKEEQRLRGEKAAANFIALWRETHKLVLPKLTSHVSRINEKSLSKDKQMRTCSAHYYTEVLEDFGNGWRDKKGDKSPKYVATYRIACKHNKATSIAILTNSIHKAVSAQHYRLYTQQDTPKKNPEKAALPLCSNELVHKNLTRASLTSHARARADEERRKYGVQAENKFLALWEKTEPILSSKLVSHISNIESKGMDYTSNARICSARYYTEVLEDFGNGWRDKKGDKSPEYEIYFTLRYSNDRRVLIVRILSQNKVRNK
ncbi:hypothetical protein CQA66_06195 [Helicobacter aurati]|uniref:Uncharacterized protein n=1 Tax=Helicobacter aurati TaxID=137778 RepID=A0A3D8J228_9HELI|nr:hypothetical protein CQA66_06195 [Helicobacter aurati]